MFHFLCDASSHTYQPPEEVSFSLCVEEYKGRKDGEKREGEERRRGKGRGDKGYSLSVNLTLIYSRIFCAGSTDKLSNSDRLRGANSFSGNLIYHR